MCELCLHEETHKKLFLFNDFFWICLREHSFIDSFPLLQFIRAQVFRGLLLVRYVYWQIFLLHYLMFMVEKITLYSNQIHTISIALLTKQQQGKNRPERGKKRPNKNGSIRIFGRSSRVPVF